MSSKILSNVYERIVNSFERNHFEMKIKLFLHTSSVATSDMGYVRLCALGTSLQPVGIFQIFWSLHFKSSQR